MQRNLLVLWAVLPTAASWKAELTAADASRKDGVGGTQASAAGRSLLQPSLRGALRLSALSNAQTDFVSRAYAT